MAATPNSTPPPKKKKLFCVLGKPPNSGRVAKRKGLYHRVPTFTKGTSRRQGSGEDMEGKARTQTSAYSPPPLNVYFNSPSVGINKELRLGANTFLHNDLRGVFGG